MTNWLFITNSEMTYTKSSLLTYITNHQILSKSVKKFYQMSENKVKIFLPTA